MVRTELEFGDESRKKILAGIETIVGAVEKTSGPCGRNVILSENGSFNVSKDGVSVANSITLKDDFENIGCSAVKEACSKTNAEAGDGTTTTAILLKDIYKNGLKHISNEVNSIGIKNGINIATKEIIKSLSMVSDDITCDEQIKQIATISANNDTEIGDIIAEVFNKVGTDGAISIEKGKTADTTLDLIEGMEFDRGYLSPYMINDIETGTCILNNPMILLAHKKIKNIKEILPVLKYANQNQRDLLIVTEDMENDVLSGIVLNIMKGVVRCAVVKSPGFGEGIKNELDDIAVTVGCKIVSEDSGMSIADAGEEYFGSCEKVVITKDSTLITKGTGNDEQIQDYIKNLRTQIANEEDNYEASKLKKRLGKVEGKVGSINIGANTESEMREKADRIQDSLSATRAAISGGIVPGGGLALIIAKFQTLFNEEQYSFSENLGIKIVLDAIEAPIRRIAENGGFSGDVVVNTVSQSGSVATGFDARNNEYVDMIEAGIIDPTNVVKSALQNASSIAGLLLTTECMVVNTREEEPIPQQPMM